MSCDIHDDEVTLLQPCNLEEGRRNERNIKSVDESTSANICKHLPSTWHLLFASIVLVFSATALVVTLPVYLQAVNVAGSAYAGTVFIWLMVTLSVILYCFILYYPHFYRPKSYSCGVSDKVTQYGIWHGIACLAVVYSLDRKRVLCHTQEPLMGLIVLYMIILYCFYRGPVMSSRKLVCLCGVLAGLCLAMDFQLNDIYLCRGQARTSPATDGGDWSMQEHALWTIVYAAALFLYTLAWMKMEQLMNRMSKLRCFNDEVCTVSGQLLLSPSLHSTVVMTTTTLPPTPKQTANSPQLPLSPSTPATSGGSSPEHPPPYQASLQRTPSQAPFAGSEHPPPHHTSCRSLASTISLCSSSTSTTTLFPPHPLLHQGFTPDRFNALILRFTIASLATIVALFWTDFFTALGKSGSVAQFVNLTLAGVACHFRGREGCGPTALHGWLMVVYMLLFLWSVRELCVSSRSVIFPLSVASLALPLSALFWGAFREGGPYGIEWSPEVTGELIFSSLGLPLMVTFLYYWAKIDRHELEKEMNDSNSSRNWSPPAPLTRTLPHSPSLAPIPLQSTPQPPARKEGQGKGEGQQNKCEGNYAA